MSKLTKATKILIAGFSINLCLGILYAWSVFNKSLVTLHGWNAADASQPYAVATITFSIALLVAGILQDRMGPRNILILGTSLTGLGMIASSFASTPMQLSITFGVIAGAGIGFGYACLAPAAMKWFHSSKKGLVNGLIAAGFGLAAVYLAPLTSALINHYGIDSSFLILGIGVLVISVPLAATITNPPEGYVPEAPAKVADKVATAKPAVDINWKTMLKTPQFYSLWIMYAFASATGLMIIANITTIAAKQANIAEAVYLASLLAIFNSGGRIGAGLLSDKIGGIRTLLLAFALQGINMVFFASYTNEMMLIVGTAAAAIGYGTLLAVFPSLTAEFYGLKNYGTNYGVLYTAWGIGGAIGTAVVGISMSIDDGYNTAYMITAVMMAICVALTFVTKPVALADNAENNQALPNT